MRRYHSESVADRGIGTECITQGCSVMEQETFTQNIYSIFMIVLFYMYARKGRNEKLPTPNSKKKKHSPILDGPCNSPPRETKLYRQEPRSKKPKKESQKGDTRAQKNSLKLSVRSRICLTSSSSTSSSTEGSTYDIGVRGVAASLAPNWACSGDFGVTNCSASSKSQSL